MRSLISLKTLLLVTLLLSALPAFASDVVFDKPNYDDMRLLRFPDIHEQTIVFSYAGDLWTVSSTGGRARRLTGSVGFQNQAKFSPDGKTIAFSGNYDGNNDVYLVNAQGGEPERLTWHPGQDRVIDWQPDGQSVRFQSRRQTRTGRDMQLYTVDKDGGLPVRNPLPTGGLSSYSPDGTKMAYNRMSREHRTWKRYKGGMAQDIWIYDFNKNDTAKITDWIGSDNYPMWQGDTVYYNSDKSGNLQIWAYDTKTGEHRQITEHKEYDVKNPSQGPGAIVYENGGWLWVLNLKTERSTRIVVSLHSDNPLTRPTIKNVGTQVRSGSIAPDAKRAVFGARGDIFTVPAEKGNIRNLTATPGVRERNPVWSPDGKNVAYLSDESGEYEIWLKSGDGKGEARQLTKGSNTYKMNLAWSPDSKHLLMNDAAMTLYLVNAESGKIKTIDKSVSGEIQDFDWSPHSDWVAYAKGEENGFRSIFLYNLDNEKTHRVTSDFTDEGSPCFDQNGNYLFFTSGKHFNPTLGGFDLKPLWGNMEGIYLVTLREDVEHPLPPESDEVEVKDDEEDAEKSDDDDDDEDGDNKDNDDKKDEESEKEDETLIIDLEGLAQRMVDLGVGPGQFGNLRHAEGKLFYTSRPFQAGGSQQEFSQRVSIKLFDFEEREEKTVLGGAFNFELSADGKKLFYRNMGGFGIVSAAADQKPSDKPLRTSEMQARVNPRAEWKQMFRDAWRQERDFFYDPGMHGMDWDEMYDRYGQLVPYVAHGADFTFILGELIGELNCSHSYVRGGDMPRPNRVGTGLLGCDFTVDRESDRYRFGRIFRDRNWDSTVPTPLHQPGMDVNNDDYIISIDGENLTLKTNPYSLLENKVGQQVVLEIGPNPSGKDSREITVTPIAGDGVLRYEAWVEDNRRRVDELSDGRIGYLHLPNTAVGGQKGFAKGYYPNLRKDGIIIDERFNGGGFIPDFFMNILRQKLVNLWKPRYGQDWRTPGTAFLGHMAMISNGYAGSGGDALPYYFKFYELGPVIGTRTWGGLVGVSRGIGLMDGGGVTFPEFGLFDSSGNWDVENYGVDPTIPLDNLPHELVDGKDPQLEKAVEVLLQKIKDEPMEVPSVRGFPRNKK